MISEELQTTGQSGQAEALRIGKALSPKQSCEALGCGLTYLYSLINRGDLVAHKIGRRTVIFQEDLFRFRETLPVIAPKQRPIQSAA